MRLLVGVVLIGALYAPARGESYYLHPTGTGSYNAYRTGTVQAATLQAADAEYRAKKSEADAYSSLGDSLTNLGSAMGGRSSDTKTAREELALAVDLADQGQWAAADSACSRVIDIGRQYIVPIGTSSEACEVFKVRATCRIRLGLLRSALSDLRMAHKFDKRDIETRALLAVCLAHAGRPDEAREVFSKLRLAPASTEREREAVLLASEELGAANGR